MIKDVCLLSLLIHDWFGNYDMNFLKHDIINGSQEFLVYYPNTKFINLFTLAEHRTVYNINTAL